jgi:hypothetical protein
VSEKLVKFYPHERRTQPYRACGTPPLLLKVTHRLAGGHPLFPLKRLETRIRFAQQLKLFELGLVKPTLLPTGIEIQSNKELKLKY